MKEMLLLILFTTHVFSMNLWNKCDQRSKQNKVAVRDILELSDLKPSQILRFPMWRRSFPLFVNADAQLDKIKKPNQITVAELTNRRKSLKKFHNLVLIYVKVFAIVAAFAFGDVFSTISVLMLALLHLMIMTAGWNAFMKKLVLTSMNKWQKMLIYVSIVAMIIYVLFPIIGFKILSAIDNNFCPLLESTGIVIPDAFQQLNTKNLYVCVLNDGFAQNLGEYKKQMVASLGMLGYVANAGDKLWNIVIKQIAKSKIGTCGSLNCSAIISHAENRRTVYYLVSRRRDSQSFKFFENTETEDHLFMDKFGRLNENGNFNQIDEYGRNLAHDAALFGRLQFLKFLATKHVDLNKPDKDGRTPVSEAATYGTTEMVKFFAEQGVDLNKSDKDGRTPVSKAASNGKTENVKFLAEKGVDLNKPDKYGATPVSEATSLEIVKFLAEKGVDLNKPDKYGATPVSKAAANCETEIVKFFAEQGVDLNTPDKYGRTPVSGAASCETTETVKYFAEQGVHLNTPDKVGDTPIWRAALHGRTETIKFLEKQGVDLNQSDELGRTLLDIAALFGRKGTVKFLLQKNIKFNKKFFHAGYRNVDEIKWLINESYRANNFKIFQNIENTCKSSYLDFYKD